MAGCRQSLRPATSQVAVAAEPPPCWTGLPLAACPEEGAAPAGAPDLGAAVNEQDPTWPKHSLKVIHDTDSAVKALYEAGWMLPDHHMTTISSLLSYLGARVAVSR